jgi:hypothetical protein
LSKVLQATCDATGKVTADGVIVAGAVVFSEGKQASSGLLLLEGETAFYIPSSATDIKTTLEKLISILTDVTSALTTLSTIATSIGAGMSGSTTAPPPTLGSNVSDVTAKVADLNTIKTALTTLKGALK